MYRYKWVGVANKVKREAKISTLALCDGAPRFLPHNCLQKDPQCCNMGFGTEQKVKSQNINICISFSCLFYRIKRWIRWLKWVFVYLWPKKAEVVFECSASWHLLSFQDLGKYYPCLSLVYLKSEICENIIFLSLFLLLLWKRSLLQILFWNYFHIEQ